MPTVVIGTAGHIDHGKTTLLRALTGIDADRLPEERARGMTIDVGYAHLVFDDGVELDFVDVPGHDRLVGNMLVGAGEIDAALLVVAADDGPRPQTIEHLALLDAIGIATGLAVVTRADLVPRSRAEAVADETERLLARTRLAGAPVVIASATTGAGLAELQSALRAVRDQVAGRGAERGPARLAVDRAFSVPGRGTVVTGTLRAGRVAAGDTVRLEPAGRAARVRAVQVHGQPRDGHDGGRAALNLAGVAVGEVNRGDVVVRLPRAAMPDEAWPEAVTASTRLLVELTQPAALGGAPAWPPADGARLRLHLATAAVEARLGRRGREGSGPPDRATGLLTLDRPVATFRGQRGVLRRAGSGVLLAGARVLDPQPPRGASRRRLTPDRLERLIAAIDGGDPTAMGDASLELHGLLPGLEDARPSGAARSRLRFADDVRASLEERAAALVRERAEADPSGPGVGIADARAVLLRDLRSMASVERSAAREAADAVGELIDGLVRAGRLAREGTWLREPSAAPGLAPELAAAMDRLEAALAVPAPPSLAAAAAAAGCPPGGLRALQAAGRIVRLEPDLAWATPTYHRLAALALEMARRGPLSPASFRDATGSSRRYALAILEDLDRRGVLVRTPDGHVPGPRAPAAPAGAVAGGR